MFIKNKLKYLIIFLIGLVIILTLTIILQIPGLKAQPVTLKLLVLEQETNYWQDLIAEFEQHNPNIHINLDNGSNISNELAQIYINDFQSNIPEYDIIYMDIIWVAQFAHNNWLKDLSPFLDKNQTKQLQQAFLANDLTSGYYNDKLYRLPFRSGVSLIYYRQDLLEAIAAQPPKTFDDLISITKTLKNKGLVREGYLWQGREYEGIVTIFMEIIQGYGGFWINENGEVGLNQPPAIKAVKFLRSLIQKEQISPKSVLSDEERDSLDKFKNGKAAFLRNWAEVWEILNSEDSFIRGKVGVIPIPTVGDSQTHWSCQGGWGLGMANHTKYPQETWKAIKFLTKSASIRQFANQGYIPSRKDYLKDPQLIKKYHHYPIIRQSLENTVLRPSIPEYFEISKILQHYLHKALNTEKDIQEIMESATQETIMYLKEQNKDKT